MNESSHITAFEPPTDPLVAAFREADLLRAQGSSATDNDTPAAALPMSAAERTAAFAASFPGYLLIREIHRGGQGVVYQALRETTGQDVAIKVLHDRRAASPRELERFEREAEILRELNHPNLIAVSEIGVAAGRPYLVMPYIAGWPLDEHVRRNGLSVRETLVLFAKVCEAVNAAHLNGVIHRDIKPSNIRIDDAGEPHVLDFGLAKLTRPTPTTGGEPETLASLTETGQFVGSLPWASPEQADPSLGRVDIRTDVYSLGAVLYQLLAGVWPIDPVGSQREVLNRIVTAEPVRCSVAAANNCGLAGGIDSDVETIVQKCLEKERARRYSSAGDLAADIRRYLAGEAIEAKRDSRWYLLRKALRRYRLPLGIAAAFILLLAGGLLSTVILWQHAAQQEAESRELAEFQAKILTEFDPEQMGADQRADVISNAEKNWKLMGVPQEEIDERRTKLETQLTDVNFTSVALQSLRRDVFESNLAAIQREFADQPLVKARLLQHLAKTLLLYDFWDPAKAALTEALEIRRRRLGEEHLETLKSIEQAAQWHISRWSELEVAESLARRVLEVRSRKLGENHPDTLGAKYLLGEVLRRTPATRLDEATEVHRAALAGRRAELGNEHVDTLRSIAALGQTLVSNKKLADAEPLALELYQRASQVRDFQRDYPGAAPVLMGMLREAQGRPKEAEKYYRQCLEHSRPRWGDARRSSRWVEKALGLMLRRQGRFAEAEPLFESGLEYFRRVKGPDDFETINSMQLLALLRLDQQRWEEAEKLSREGLALAKSPRAKPFRIQLASVLVHALRKLEQEAEANAIAVASVREVLDDFEAWTAPAAVPVPDTRHFFRVICLVEDGVELRREFIRLCDEKLGPTDLRTLDYKAKLASHLGKDRIDEAEQLSREAVEGFSAAHTAPHKYWVDALRTRSGILLKLGRADEALNLLEQEKTMHRALGAEMGPRDAQAYVRHSDCLRLAGRFADAERELRECHERLTADAYAEEKDVRAIVEAMVKLLDAWHAAEPAGEYDAKAANWRAWLEATTQPAPTGTGSK